MKRPGGDGDGDGDADGDGDGDDDATHVTLQSAMSVGQSTLEVVIKPNMPTS